MVLLRVCQFKPTKRLCQIYFNSLSAREEVIFVVGRTSKNEELEEDEESCHGKKKKTTTQLAMLARSWGDNELYSCVLGDLFLSSSDVEEKDDVFYSWCMSGVRDAYVQLSISCLLVQRRIDRGVTSFVYV